MKKEGLVRKYRVRKIKYKYIKAERLPGELVEIDVKLEHCGLNGQTPNEFLKDHQLIKPPNVCA